MDEIPLLTIGSVMAIFFFVMAVLLLASIAHLESLFREEFLSNLAIAVERKNLKREEHKTSRLLLNILPEVVGEKLKNETDRKRKSITIVR